LPALIALLPPDAERVKLTPSTDGWLGRALAWPYTYSRQIWIGAALLAVGSLALAPRARFDYDPINLRDPKAESVATFRDLVRDPNIPSLALSAVAPDAKSAQQLSDQFGQLPLVRRAMSLNDLVPKDQDAKLAIIQDLSFTLGPALSGSGKVQLRANDADDRAAIEALRASLPAYIKTQGGTRAARSQALLDALDRFHAELAKRDAAGQAKLLAALREDLLSAIPAHLEDLKMSLQADHVGENDLPPNMLASWKSSDGHYRVEVWPKEILDTPAAIEHFVDQVRGAYPEAVGGPRGMMEAGRAVVAAFKTAFVYSLIAITVLLLVLLRSVGDTVLVLIPLTLAGLLTLAGTVLFNIPFNFANVIALPLILGVGVDYGVYLVQRGRAAGAQVNILQTSTARAVLYGALITMANFGNLALAKHPGMVSMGLLLTIGLGMTLVCALVLLPSLLARRRSA
ncbi:MAG TPA: MMPL family transporter, partial [Nevskiaceae bacterium]|nr:MMPL family transporter [Nevskiaceae bacterium]